MTAEVIRKSTPGTSLSSTNKPNVGGEPKKTDTPLGMQVYCSLIGTSR